MILSTLSPADYAYMASGLEHVTLATGTVLYDAGSTIQHVYFPCTALVSLVGLTTTGQGTEIGMIGAEGFCGIPILFGAQRQRFGATIQIAGSLDKVPVGALDETNGKTPLSDVLRRSALTQLSQIMQSAICNRFHTLTQRLSRWLLTAADRVATSRLELTQEYLAQMIGAQRSTVAEVVSQLETQGFLVHTRGCLDLVDHVGMEKAACECYALMKEDMEAYLQGPEFSAPA